MLSMSATAPTIAPRRDERLEPGFSMRQIPTIFPYIFVLPNEEIPKCRNPLKNSKSVWITEDEEEVFAVKSISYDLVIKLSDGKIKCRAEKTLVNLFGVWE